jgi:hypothetical protein
MTRSRLAKSLVLAVASTLSAACATTRYTQSRIAPPQAKGRGAEAARLEIEGVKVRVESLDRAPREQGTPSFAVRVVFAPEALGFSFDPGQVVLRDAGGRTWHAGAGGYQPLGSGASFDLSFDAAVAPGKPMELVLGGLACGTKRIEPVTLRLARGEGRSYDRLYWLEALGKVLLVPLGILSYGVGAGM